MCLPSQQITFLDGHQVSFSLICLNNWDQQTAHPAWMSTQDAQPPGEGLRSFLLSLEYQPQPFTTTRIPSPPSAVYFLLPVGDVSISHSWETSQNGPFLSGPLSFSMLSAWQRGPSASAFLKCRNCLCSVAGRHFSARHTVSPRS